MVEFAGLDLARSESVPPDRWFSFVSDPDNHVLRSGLMAANLGVLGVIGEQNATRFFAQLGSRFDRDGLADYRAIFAAWGGDVRECRRRSPFRRDPPPRTGREGRQCRQ